MKKKIQIQMKKCKKKGIKIKNIPSCICSFFGTVHTLFLFLFLFLFLIYFYETKFIKIQLFCICILSVD